MSVQFQRFAPDVLTVPFYFNPTTLSDPATDGNRILLAAFTDTYDNTGFRIPPTTPGFSFDYVMEGSARTTLVNTFSDVGRTDPIAVNGVLFTNVQTLAGSVPLTTQGKVAFIASTSPIPNDANIFGLVSQAVGPFESARSCRAATPSHRWIRARSRAPSSARPPAETSGPSRCEPASKSPSSAIW